MAPMVAAVAFFTLAASPATAQAPATVTISSYASTPMAQPLSGPYSSCIPPFHVTRRSSTTIEVWSDTVDFRNTYYSGEFYVTLADSNLNVLPGTGGPWYIGPTQGFDKTFTLPSNGYVGFHLTDADDASTLCITDVQHV